MRLIDADAFKACMKGALEQTRNAYTDGGEWAQTITEQFCEAIDEQPTIELNTDTISRQDAINLIERYCDNGCEIAEDKWCPDCQQSQFAKMIKALPPSPSKPKGRWIPLFNGKFKGGSYWFQCSECERIVPEVRNGGWNFCPNCGADMLTEDKG